MLHIKEEMSRYDYIKYIDLACINHEQYWPKKVPKAKKRKVPVETFTITRGKIIVVASDTSACSSTSSKKKGPIVYADLHPSNGMLSFSLNTSFHHLPKATNEKRAICQLHIWERGRGGK